MKIRAAVVAVTAALALPLAACTVEDPDGGAPSGQQRSEEKSDGSSGTTERDAEPKSEPKSESGPDSDGSAPADPGTEGPAAPEQDTDDSAPADPEADDPAPAEPETDGTDPSAPEEDGTDGTKQDPAASTVTFKVWGTASSGVDTTYGSDSENIQGEGLPMTKTLKVSEDALYYAVTAQLQGGGDIRCSVTIGDETKKGHAKGSYNICSAQLNGDLLGGWE